MSQVTSRAGRNKVKSGCRTCKLRRVKCDEAWPICRRCVSTGRVCEGYGVWGGGNRFGFHSIGLDNTRSLRKVYSPALIDGVSSDESRSLEWFTYRTAPKLPGAFKFGFWDTLVFQAVSKEPAVLHAVLALSSAHKREGLLIESPVAEYSPDEQEQFTIRQYSKAINCLQPHFSAHDNSSIRVALVTCLIFIFTEHIRGHYKTSNTHLQTGLKLLSEFHAHSSAIDCYSLFQEPCCDSVDAWIIQGFIRLDVQAKFLGQSSQYLDFMLEDTIPKNLSSGLIFQSVNQGRQHLDRLFNHIFYLNHECHNRLSPYEQAYPDDLLTKQQDIRNRLASWYQAFKISKANLKDKELSSEVIGYLLLDIYYTMALIMADTCLWPSDESLYDAHTDNFASMMKQLDYVRSLTASQASIPGILHLPDMSKSVADLGALSAVYYIAVKCRVHRLRHDAVEYLETLSHKEGVWNAPITACIAREVIKIEEADFYQDGDIVKNVTEKEKNGAIELILPESYRVHDVDIELPEDYAGTVAFKCKRRRGGSDWQVITRQYRYSEKTRTWIEKGRN